MIFKLPKTNILNFKYAKNKPRKIGSRKRTHKEAFWIQKRSPSKIKKKHKNNNNSKVEKISKLLNIEQIEDKMASLNNVLNISQNE